VRRAVRRWLPVDGLPGRSGALLPAPPAAVHGQGGASGPEWVQWAAASRARPSRLRYWSSNGRWSARRASMGTDGMPAGNGRSTLSTAGTSGERTQKNRNCSTPPLLLGRYRTFLRATTAFAPLQPTFPCTNSPVAPNIEGGVEQLQKILPVLYMRNIQKCRFSI